jgi:hypothetical protein
MHQFLVLLILASTSPVGFVVKLALKPELPEFNAENKLRHLLVCFHSSFSLLIIKEIP